MNVGGTPFKDPYNPKRASRDSEAWTESIVSGLHVDVHPRPRPPHFQVSAVSAIRGSSPSNSFAISDYRGEGGLIGRKSREHLCGLAGNETKIGWVKRFGLEESESR